MRVAVVGATGYAGMTLLRWLARHPVMKLAAAVSGHAGGEPLDEYLIPSPGLPDRLVDYETFATMDPPDVVFAALSTGEGMEWFRRWLEAGVRVIDLGASFRFAEADRFAQYYGPHPAPELLAYGFSGYADDPAMTYPERGILGNPGCYPTAFALAVLPLVRAWGPIAYLVADGKSGVTGAGRRPRVNLLMGEMAENFEPYSEPGRHRHTPEMEGVSGGVVLFQPHLVPMAQGLSMTIYWPDCPHRPEAVVEVWRAFYRDNPFVFISSRKPRTQAVRETNQVWLAAARDDARRTLVLYSAIDNLVKGAAGHAIQHANRWLGLPAATGLLPREL
ncbi:MAG: N-acetyl-gamma-glutamyl-phosphate reductase [Firmicutes bacterium]|nr:N-acetyl-gamma-glutamyl-phosphate reductase [Alicyclobacillaceae bacterium]MCL6498041.1 N-acetyl-gamma-glutamyl-phosphate reductase [Bacillota bacterium]